MKKLNFLFYILLTISLVSCFEEADDWNSATTNFDGNWYVRYDHQKYGEDAFGKGYLPVYTYNTTDNEGDSIWIQEDSFRKYKIVLPIDQRTRTFGSSALVDNKHKKGKEIQFTIKNGIIVKDAITLPSGVKADSIYFELWDEALEGQTNIADDVLYVSGYRKTGFQEDEPDH